MTENGTGERRGRGAALQEIGRLVIENLIEGRECFPDYLRDMTKGANLDDAATLARAALRGDKRKREETIK